MLECDPFVVRDADSKLAGVDEDAELLADIRTFTFHVFGHG